MKSTVVAIMLSTVTFAIPAMAADVGVSISIGEPGFYGHLDIGNVERPQLLYNRPVLIDPRYRNLAPIYLRVPPRHAKNWKRYCSQYDACSRPVYFVRDDWYRNVYAPRYRKEHGGGGRDEGRNDRRDEGGDSHHDARDAQDHGHGQGHGNDKH